MPGIKFEKGCTYWCSPFLFSYDPLLVAASAFLTQSATCRAGPLSISYQAKSR
jgi:hypothetical protein